MTIKMKIGFALLLFGMLAMNATKAQTVDSIPSRHDFRFSGQLSGWGSITPDIETKGWLGSRYIPQVNYTYTLSKDRLIDFEGSASLFGELGVTSVPTVTASGNINPYRLWARYATQGSEVRLGLQKINFGSALLFRPLMWFDKMDPRDPLQMTSGVWGGLYRRYLLNNSNIWLWVLAGNKDPKGWELYGTGGNLSPEAGGRVQLPIPTGEAALSYHFRRADIVRINPPNQQANEQRIGFDVRADVTVGLWLEASLTHYDKDIGGTTNQQMITLGSDYTFDLGNGLGVTAEHLLYGMGSKLFSYEETLNFSGLSLSYPFTLIDDVTTMLFYDWKNQQLYSFINWQKQFNRISFYLMGFWNPETYQIPGQGSFSRFTGKGLQLMVVWNH